MKTLLPRIVLFLFAVALFSACQGVKTGCPAYSSAFTKPLNKPTFLKDYSRR